MGYQLQTVHAISPDDQHEYFVYLIETFYNSPFQKWFDKHFSQIAHDLGPSRGVIIRGLDKARFHHEMHSLIYGNLDGPFHDAFYWTEDRRFGSIPYYLVSNKPPSRFNDSDCFLYLVPLVDIPKGYFDNSCRPLLKKRPRFESLYVEAVTRVLVDAILTGNFETLKQRAILCSGRIQKTSILTILKDTIEVKPSIFGLLEVDVRKLIDHLWKRHKSDPLETDK